MALIIAGDELIFRIDQIIIETMTDEIIEIAVGIMVAAEIM